MALPGGGGGGLARRAALAASMALPERAIPLCFTALMGFATCGCSALLYLLYDPWWGSAAAFAAVS